MWFHKLEPKFLKSNFRLEPKFLKSNFRLCGSIKKGYPYKLESFIVIEYHASTFENFDRKIE